MIHGLDLFLSLHIRVWNLVSDAMLGYSQSHSESLVIVGRNVLAYLMNYYEYRYGVHKESCKASFDP